MPDDTPARKTCSKCGDTKPLDEFHRNKSRRDGLNHWCKPCNRGHVRRYAQDNRDTISAKRKAEYAADPERGRQRVREYTKRAPEAVSASKRRYYAKNCERLKQAVAERYWRDPELARERGRIYERNRIAKDPQAWRLQQAAASAVRRARVRAVQQVPFTPEQLAQRLAYFGNRCWMCGAPGTAVDHVKPIVKGGANMLSNLRPACTPCNGGKAGRWPYTPPRKLSA